MRRPPAKSGQGIGGCGALEMIAGEGNPAFFKIILPPAIEERALRIPERFVRDFGSDLSSMALFSVPNTESWKVSIRSEGSELWFSDGWQEFVQNYAITCGYFLVFKYQGKSVFRVHIFDLSACEISYPCSNSLDSDHKLPQNSQPERVPSCSGSEHDDCDNDKEDDSKCASDDEVTALEKEKMDSVDIIEVSSDDGDTLDRTRAKNLSSRLRSREETKNAMIVRSNNSDRGLRRKSMEEIQIRDSVASNLKSHKTHNPTFRVSMKPYNLNMSTQVCTVPSDIARKHLKGDSGRVRLEVSDGRKWQVHGNFIRGRLAALGQGWGDFANDNDLQVGDICRFELIGRYGKDFRMKVAICHVPQNLARRGPLRR